MSLTLPVTPLAKAAELAVTDANLLALAQTVAAHTAAIASNASAAAANATSIQNLAAQLGLDEAQIAKLVAAALPPIPPIIIPPPYDPQIQWRTGMESGTLDGWSEQVNTGNATSSAVQVALEGIPPRVSKLFNLPSVWAMKQSCTPTLTSSAGTRMSRYPEINALCKAGTPFYYSWWDFFPAALDSTAGWYNHWQIMSNDPAMLNAPIWVLSLAPTGMTPILAWSPNNLAPAEGPHAGEAGPRAYSANLVVPVGQWVFFEVMVTPRGDFTGALKVWVNGTLAFDLSSIKTQFPYVSQALFTYVANNCYGQGLSPLPWSHYVDDVTVSLGRMP